jgi:hypothetical protein
MDSEVELKDWWKMYMDDSEQESLGSGSPAKEKRINTWPSVPELKKRE